MATITRFASTNAVVATGWTNPTNAYADDTAYATCSPSKGGHITSDYGFAAFTSSDIPDGATIDSVTVQARAWGANAVLTESIQGVDNGVLVGSAATTTATAETTITATVPGIVLADLRSALVKARLDATRSGNTAYTASLDWVSITVNYSLVDARSGAAGNLAATASLAGGAGHKDGQGAAGTLVAGTGTASGGTGRKGGQGVLGSNLASASMSAAGTHQGRVALGALAAVPGFSLVGRHNALRALGALASGTSQAAGIRKGGLSSYTSGGGAPATVGQDDFSGSGGLVGRTAQVGGTWAQGPADAQGMVPDVLQGFAHLDAYGDVTAAWDVLKAGTLGDGDVYATMPYTQDGWGSGPAARIISTTHAYAVSTVPGGYLTLYRVTGGLQYVVYNDATTPLAGVPVRARLQVSGSSPTALRARRWQAGQAEPGTWAIDTTDNTAGNQAASGGAGIYLSSDASDYPVLFGWADDYLAQSAGGATITPGLGTITAGTTMAATGARGVANRNAALGNLAAVTSQALAGRGAHQGALGALAASTSMAATGRKGALGAGAQAITTSQAGTGRHGGVRALGTIQAGSAQASSARKGGLGAAGILAAASGQALAGRHAGTVALGVLVAPVTPGMVLTGSSGQSTNRYAALGNIGATAALAGGAGRHGGQRAVGNLVAGTASLASGAGRKGGQGAATATYLASLVLAARKGARGSATMAPTASLAAQGRKQGRGVAVQSAGVLMAVLGRPGRAGALGDLAAGYALAAAGSADVRALDGTETASLGDDRELGILSDDMVARVDLADYHATITEG